MVWNGRTRQRNSIVATLNGIECWSFEVLYQARPNTIDACGRQGKWDLGPGYRQPSKGWTDYVGLYLWDDGSIFDWISLQWKAGTIKVEHLEKDIREGDHHAGNGNCPPEDWISEGVKRSQLASPFLLLGYRKSHFMSRSEIDWPGTTRLLWRAKFSVHWFGLSAL